MSIQTPHDASPATVSQWLRVETEQQLKILTRIRLRLVARLDALDLAGSTSVPDRDWMRAHHAYTHGFALLLVEERERAKLALTGRAAEGRPELAGLAGGQSLLGPGVTVGDLEAQVRAEFARAAATFTTEDLELLARNLRPEAWAVLDRVRAERTP